MAKICDFLGALRMKQAILATRFAIGRAQLSVSPFPHIIVPNVMPQHIFNDVLKHWPETSRMAEYTDDAGRFLFQILAHSDQLPHEGETDYWKQFIYRYARHLIRAALSRFATYNKIRYGRDAQYTAQLDLLQAGPRFNQIPPHTHFCHSVGWAMTFLLFMNDGDRSDRGEVFSAPTRDSSWINIVASGPKFNLREAKEIPFVPNTLVAWLDGPMSYRGTEVLPFDEINKRQMFRCHVIVREQFLARALGMSTAQFFEVCQKHWAGQSEELESVLNRPNNPINVIPKFTFSD